MITTLYKPNGVKMEVNDTSLSHALSLGWTKTDPTKKPVKSTLKSTIKKVEKQSKAVRAK